jgi:hypothetical protein
LTYTITRNYENRGLLSDSTVTTYTTNPGIWTGSIYTGPNGTVFPTFTPQPEALIEADYKAKAKLFEALKGEGANIANMFAERRQTTKSIANAVNVMVYAMRDLRRGNISSAVRRFGGDPLTARKLRKKDIADQWLSLQYGWKPLLKDIYDLTEGLHHREKTLVKIIKGKSSHVIRKKSNFSVYQHPHNPNINTGLHITQAKVMYMVRVRPNAVLAEPAALGLTNPLVVLWEVTPWSFVVDWVLPVGRYLEQLSATHGWTFYDGCRSALEKTSTTGGYASTKVTVAGTQTTVDSRSFSGGESVYDTFSRTTLAGFPIPDVPQFKNPFSAGHALNAIALLSQVFGRK